MFVAPLPFPGYKCSCTTKGGSEEPMTLGLMTLGAFNKLRIKFNIFVSNLSMSLLIFISTKVPIRNNIFRQQNWQNKGRRKFVKLDWWKHLYSRPYRFKLPANGPDAYVGLGPKPLATENRAHRVQFKWAIKGQLTKLKGWPTKNLIFVQNDNIMAV